MPTRAASLTGKVSEEKLVCDVGGGSNGKSTFYSFIRRALGDYYWSLSGDTLLAARRGAHSTELTDVEGKRLVSVIELTENASMNEERVKALVSIDPITARRMRRDSRTFIPSHKLWLGTNNLPRIEDPTHGFWRRVKVVPWTQQFPVNEELPRELEQELPGILRWLVEAAVEYNQAGLGAESKLMLEATTAYRESEDDLGDWAAEGMVEEDDAFLSTREGRVP